MSDPKKWTQLELAFMALRHDALAAEAAATPHLPQPNAFPEGDSI